MEILTSILKSRATAAFLGALIAWLFGLKLGPEFNSEIKSNLIGLVSTLATITAGYIALQGPLRQIAQSDRQEEQRRNGEKIKHRALVAVGASELHSLCTSSLSLCLKVASGNASEEDLRKISKIKLDDKILAKLVNILPYEKAETRSLVEITVQVYQICVARVSENAEINDEEQKMIEFRKNALDWLILTGLKNHLYDLSRNGSDYAIEKIDTKKFKLPLRVLNNGKILSAEKKKLESRIKKRSAKWSRKHVSSLKLEDFFPRLRKKKKIRNLNNKK